MAHSLFEGYLKLAVTNIKNISENRSILSPHTYLNTKVPLYVCFDFKLNCSTDLMFGIKIL